jgi:acyl-CoA thioesterase I
VGVSRRACALAVLTLAVAAAAGAQTTQRIVAFGDSITFGLGDSPGKGGYPARLASLLTTPETTYNVENEGVSGETTAEGLSRLSSLSGSGTDAMLLMEGTNDTFLNISPETIAQNLVAMVKKARGRGFAKVYLSTIIPIGITSSGARYHYSIFLAEQIRQVAWEEKLPTPDPHQAFYDIENRFDTHYITDGIHPNADGSRRRRG